ncbi:hypothetical protein [Butyrivibrio sp. NC2002]|uniref:hypothetical protein n=1 Tax=Butyrivibrio sp. NC2002 TaxID=1410610 RepID=UPI000569297E|nr:hypothetical protein [Butyrivibrio sp. NC2002]
MVKNLIKIAYTLLVFIIAVILIGHFTNVETVDMTAQMSDATFPTITFEAGQRKINTLHGYAAEMDVSHMRGGVLPVDKSRSVSFSMNTYGTAVSNLRFEIRQVSGNSLVENSEITDYSQNENMITGSFQIKDLIESNQEYMLVILADMNEKTVRYYTRVVWAEDGEQFHLNEIVGFVLNFVNMTFDKNASSDELSKYLESNSEGDNTSYSHVTINSSYDQVTWGDLNIISHTEPSVVLTDIHSQTATIDLNYRVIQKTDDNEEKSYNIRESYRIRYTSDRIYLLNFDRTMNYIFSADSSDITENAINLWITQSDVELKESDGGNTFAFVSEGRLYAYNSTENKIAYVFGFSSDDADDERTNWIQSDINILSVDEAGNVEFTVTGYMNRGEHEGMVGIAAYGYDSQLNTIEERAFIPSSLHQDIVIAYSKKIQYVGANGQLYTMLDGDIFMVDFEDRSAQKVIENLSDDGYCTSDSGNAIAWQEADKKSVKIMNLTTRAESDITADSGDLIRVLGFMGEDLVYGLIRESDVHSDLLGNPVYGMYSVRIVDNEGNILENYSPDGVLITDASIDENVIRLKRARWNEESAAYEELIDDQIMSTLAKQMGSNYITVAATDSYKNIVEISVKNTIKKKSLILQTPNMTLYEGSREVNITTDRDFENDPYYYVYGLGGLVGVYDNPADAVNAGYSAPGVVVDDSDHYVWYRGNLSTSNQIMYITNLAAEWENMPAENSTAVCLDLIFQHKGISVNVQSLLDQGKSVVEILDENLTSAKILELEGCPMDAMLYYVNQDIPVMATLNDGNSLLIIGFNDLNTVLLEPSTGQVYKLGRKDTEALFSGNGNHFVTYLPE